MLHPGIPSVYSRAAHHQQHPFRLAERDRLVWRFVGERAARNFHPQAEAARAPAEHRAEQRKRRKLAHQVLWGGSGFLFRHDGSSSLYRSRLYRCCLYRFWLYGSDSVFSDRL
jgi:hypothetical protein